MTGSTAARALVCSALCGASTVAAILLTITTKSPLPSGTVGKPYSLKFEASGGLPPYHWSGNPPSGLSLSADGSLTGTPSAAGVFNFAVTVTDSLIFGDVRNFVITIQGPPLAITTASPLPPGVVDASYSQTLAVTGGTPPYRWSGILPAGLSISADGVISGKPTSAGDFTFSATVTDGASSRDSKQFALAIRPATGPLLITTPAVLPSTPTQTPYAQTLSASGGTPPYRWIWSSGPLPPGIALNPNGTLTGSPLSAGVFSFTAQVTDAASATASQAFSLTVTAGITIGTPPSLPPAVVGTNYSQTLSSAGGTPPFSWRIISGALPAGFSINGASGVISGIASVTGTFNFTVQVTDAASASATQQFTLIVTAVAGLTISSGPALPAATAGVAYAQTLTAAGGRPPYVWSIAAGSLPAGLALDASSGVIAGIPAEAGPFGFSIRVADSAGAAASSLFSLSVGAPPLPELTLSSVPDVAEPAQQFMLDLNLAGAYPLPVSGTLSVSFTPEAAVGADDPAVQLSTGGRSASFLIPPNSTQPASPLGLQTGTVAGTIQIDVTLDRAATPGLSRAIRINESVPTIRSLKLVRNQTGFELQLTGYSNTREVTRAAVRFAGSGLQTTELEMPLADLARSWYQNPASIPFGSQFTLRLPFTVQGSPNAIQSATVTVSNKMGDSRPASVDFAQ